MFYFHTLPESAPFNSFKKINLNFHSTGKIFEAIFNSFELLQDVYLDFAHPILNSLRSCFYLIRNLFSFSLLFLLGKEDE